MNDEKKTNEEEADDDVTRTTWEVVDVVNE